MSRHGPLTPESDQQKLPPTGKAIVLKTKESRLVDLCPTARTPSPRSRRRCVDTARQKATETREAEGRPDRSDSQNIRADDTQRTSASAPTAERHQFQLLSRFDCSRTHLTFVEFTISLHKKERGLYSEWQLKPVRSVCSIFGPHLREQLWRVEQHPLRF